MIFMMMICRAYMNYWEIILFAFSVPVIFNATKNNKIDRFIGELSYPVYIVHFPIIRFFSSHPFYQSYFLKYITLGTAVTVISCSLAVMLYFYIEKPINIYRQKRLMAYENSKENQFINFFPSGVAFNLLITFPLLIIGHILISQHIAPH